MGELQSYLHFRPGFEVNERSLTDRINVYDDAIDIFETIDHDQPKGVWSIQTETGGTASILRNLEWPGYALLTSSSPIKYASFYYGTGQKNHNLGYMF